LALGGGGECEDLEKKGKRRGKNVCCVRLKEREREDSWGSISSGEGRKGIVQGRLLEEGRVLAEVGGNRLGGEGDKGVGRGGRRKGNQRGGGVSKHGGLKPHKVRHVNISGATTFKKGRMWQLHVGFSPS